MDVSVSFTYHFFLLVLISTSSDFLRDLQFSFYPA